MKPESLREKATPAVAFCFFVNRLLTAESWARERLAPFAGEAFEIAAPPLPPVRATIVEGGLLEAGGVEPLLSLRVRPEALLALGRGEEELLRAVDVSGNARLAAELMALARHLRWDVEEELSKVIGDVAAHRLVAAGQAFAAWNLDVARRLAGAAADYVSDEAGLVVRRAEHAEHAREVAQLRDALERLEKRIADVDRPR